MTESKAAQELRESLTLVPELKRNRDWARVESVLAELAAVTAERNAIESTVWRVKELLAVEDNLVAITAERDKAQAACAETRQAINDVWDSISTDGSTIEGYIVNVHKLSTAKQSAQSTDCGRGYVPVSELEPTIEWLKRKCPGMWQLCGCEEHQHARRLEALKGGKG